MPRNPLVLLMSIGLFLLITFDSVMPAVRQMPADRRAVVVVITFLMVEFLLACCIVAFWAIITLLTMISRRNKPLYCDKTITLGEEGIAGESVYGKSELRWTMVQKLARTRDHLFMYLGQHNAVVIPRRAFESSTQWDAFYDYCRQKVKQAGKSAGSIVSPPVPPG
ncbi:MAG: YcxB family protein [Pedosphaera parvula]|nr:YcxB family protein [Pedosphaera parvula]